MINRQEEQKDKKEFDLSYEIKECKIWAVLGLDEVVGEYWTIMFPSEY